MHPLTHSALPGAPPSCKFTKLKPLPACRFIGLCE